MDTDKDINPELLEPWVEIDVEYDTFQAGMWQHEETAKIIVAEAEQGPFHGENPEYEILLLSGDEALEDEPEAVLETGIKGAERAKHEAEAIIATDKVEEYANE